MTEDEVDGVLVSLHLALQGLEKGQDYNARIRALGRMRTEIHWVEKRVQEEFPRLPTQKVSKPRKGRVSARSRTLREAGYEPLSKGVWSADLICRSGIKVKRGPHGGAWAPIWAVFARSADELVQAKTDEDLRALIEVRARLG